MNADEQDHCQVEIDPCLSRRPRSSASNGSDPEVADREQRPEVVLRQRLARALQPVADADDAHHRRPDRFHRLDRLNTLPPVVSTSSITTTASPAFTCPSSRSLLPCVLRLLADEEPFHVPAVPVERGQRRRRHRDRPTSSPPMAWKSRSLRRVVEQLAEQGDRLGVEEHLLRVDVVGALLPGREGEVAELEGTFAEEFLESVAGGQSWRFVRGTAVDAAALVDSL